MSHPDRCSTDITERGPPSPAPTYRSTFHDKKDVASLTPNPAASSSSSSPWPLKHGNSPYMGDEKTMYSSDEKKSHKNNGDDIELVEEPFDIHHPHYIPPAQYEAPPPERPVTLPRRRSRYPPLKIIIPWVLFAIFFLLSAWYTSIAFGVRLFTHLNPQKPIRIIINDGVPGVSSSPDTPVVITGTVKPLPPPPTPTPTSKGLVPGNGVDPDLGSNTVTTKPPGSSSTAAASSKKLDSRDTDDPFRRLFTAPAPGVGRPKGADGGKRGVDGKFSGFVTVTLK
ncbi:hypothetical protein BDV96DRAFT_688127 [Lophiotrema nucula]|uniref:Uncharacterized protein n=1 Tax=Lophiotrema nucula TaxID=690887 RepID=A0A6A5Z766_9PLEO|nr:hypothetical protein BDV96DRAFT_688127 [Lophiotrema nucula]